MRTSGQSFAASGRISCDVSKIEGGERTGLMPSRSGSPLNADGALGPLTEDSTQATTLVVDDARITPVARFVFEIPQTFIR
jgi:hypothetical protein